jgi:hypothetical protein
MAKQTLLQIPTPCTQNWEEMSVAPGGRFCDSCEKKVVDFSLMSDRQILEILRNSKGEICGRFVNEQLNRNLVVSSQQSNTLIPAVLIGSALVVGAATSVHASPEKNLPAIEQDTVRPSEKTGSVSAAEGECVVMPGYSALGHDLIIAGYKPQARVMVMGAVAVKAETYPVKKGHTITKEDLLPVTQVVSKKKRKWWAFWR